MESVVTVRRMTGGTTTDGGGFAVDAWADVLVGVPFRLGGAERGGSGSRTVTVGQSEVQLAVRVGHFPAATTGLRDDDLILVTAGENAGAVLRIVEADWQDQSTARRVPVVAVQEPEGWS